MYRPTVRYNDIFRDYVEGVFKSTSLDRNQIFRLALFAAAHSNNFQSVLQKYKKKDVPLPQPNWSALDNGFWLDLYPTAEEGREVTVKLRGNEIEANFRAVANERKRKEVEQHRRLEQIKGRNGEVSSGTDESIRIRANGGVITWSFC